MIHLKYRIQSCFNLILSGTYCTDKKLIWIQFNDFYSVKIHDWKHCAIKYWNGKVWDDSDEKDNKIDKEHCIIEHCIIKRYKWWICREPEYIQVYTKNASINQFNETMKILV